MKSIVSSGFLVLLFLLACAPKPTLQKETPPPPPAPTPTPKSEEPPDRKLEATVIREQVDKTSIAILQDTDIPGLAKLLEDYKVRELVLGQIIADYQKASSLTATERVRSEEAQKQLDELRSANKKAIDEAYREIRRIDFVELNQWRLPQNESKGLFSIRRELSAFCDAGRRLLIYGYGCPIGGEEATLRISQRRANEVTQWLERNTRCKPALLRGRGLGILIPAELLEATSKIPASQELLARSRHVRILVPRSPAESGASRR